LISDQLKVFAPSADRTHCLISRPWKCFCNIYIKLIP